VIPRNGKPVLWEELTWKDLDKLTKIIKMAIIPTAACEQHGPHLPLAVGLLIAMRLQREFLQKQVCPWFQL
jgi:creatinine amidohydrolase/Fe(II)-dependent formamide hydrolase-like protein